MIGSRLDALISPKTGEPVITPTFVDWANQLHRQIPAKKIYEAGSHLLPWAA